MEIKEIQYLRDKIVKYNMKQGKKKKGHDIISESEDG